MARPAVRRHLGVTVVPGEGAFLLCEHGSAVVTDPVARRLLPLLDGTRAIESIVDILASDVPAERIRRTLAELVRSGQVTEVDPDADRRVAGYWESLNLPGDAAAANTESGIRLTVLGAVPAAEMTSALRAAGLPVRIADDRGGSPALDVVLTDDYLRPELVEFDAASRAADRPWLLAKPVGVACLIGPVFAPDGPCYRCLSARLRGRRRAEDYLEGRLPNTRIAPPTVDIPATRLLAAGAVATAAAHWLAGHRGAHTHAVLAMDTVTLTTTTHPVQRRPQCPGCGDPGLVATRMSAPFAPVSRPKAATTDGGHRARMPDEMLRDWGHLVDPVTGVVAELRPVVTGVPGTFVYTSGANRALPVTSLHALRAGLRTQSCGKGVTDAQARASALGEALERHSAVYAGDEPSITASYAALGADAVRPNASMLYSERQFADRERWNAKKIAFEAVPEPLPDDAELDWTPMWSVTAGRVRYVPTSLLFFGYPVRGPVYALADSNGCAAGTSLEDAALQGFYELVERDSVAIWWYNRLVRRAVDLDSVGEPWVAALRAGYAALGREVWLLDVTADLGIPTVVAVSRRIDKPVEDILLAFGAHHDARVAALRALAELNQFLPAVARVGADGAGYRSADPVQLAWWRTARLADLPYLAPDPTRPAVSVAELTRPTHADLAEDLAACERLVAARGLELLALDLTRPDIGLPVVKVMVPGLRHFWSRFAAGRLYDVPVAEGWLAAPNAEDALNPTPMFI